MKLSIFALALAFSAPLAHAAPNWEACLDQSDYTLTVNDSFLNFVKVAKAGCALRFLTMGGRGEKLEVNLCDANIHIDQYTAIDATDHSTFYAGSAGCPQPMFGADFNERAEDLQKFDKAKARLMAVMENVNKTYGKHSAKIDLNNLKPEDLNTSEGKTVCTNYLIKEYLDRCTAFEGKKTEVTPAPPAFDSSSLPAGVHPAYIKKPQ